MNVKNRKTIIRMGAFLLSLVIASVSAFPTFATKEVDEMEHQLSDLNNELAGIRKKIKQTSENLAQTKEELAIAKGKEEAQYESMMLRIKYMYESGNVGLLQLLLSSSCLPEFLNNAEYISQVTEYDRKVLKELNETSKEIAEKEKQLLKDQEYLSSLQKDLDQKIKSASDELTEYKAALERAKAEAKKAEEEAKKKVEPIPPKKEEPKKDSDKDTGDDDSQISATASDVELLAALLECEAGTSNYEALLAVGSVVVNRMKSRYYPNTVRGVIYQSGQFPPAHNGKVDKVLKRGVKELCLTAARDALSGKNNVGDCLQFRSASSGFEGIIIGDNVFF